MLDLAETETDRRPVILICGYDPDDETWDPVENLDGDEWNPPGARSLNLSGGLTTARVGEVSEWLGHRASRALLLVGRTHRAGDFRVQMRAERRREGDDDHFTGPSVVRATAPVAQMIRALHEQGLAATASSDSEEDAGNELLYRILTGLPDGDVPAVGLIRAPEGMPLETIRKGVKAAASAIAGCLSPVPRSASA